LPGGSCCLFFPKKKIFLILFQALPPIDIGEIQANFVKERVCLRSAGRQGFTPSGNFKSIQYYDLNRAPYRIRRIALSAYDSQRLADILPMRVLNHRQILELYSGHLVRANWQGQTNKTRHQGV
jgi:hypothetical protein